MTTSKRLNPTMAWNGSNGNNTNGTSAAKRPVGGANKSPSIVRGTFAALTVVVLAAGVWLLVSQDGEVGDPIEGKSNGKTTKAVVKPTVRAIPSTPKQELKVEEKPVPFWELDESQTNTLSETQLKKWRTVRRPRREPFTRNRPKARYEIFDYRSENMIACLLAAKPGQGFIGTPNYKDIDKDFLESCTHPIVVAKDDDEYAADLKRQMIEVKIDLKNRMDAGEDLAEILQSSREEMQKLAEYRRLIAEEVRQVELSDESVESAKDIIDAANRLLAEKGIAPLKPNPITAHRLKTLQKEGSTK